jgi:hypothetical protein
VAIFRNNEKKHPLGYVHQNEGAHFFVPTRHQHGAEEESESHWDHEIFSWGTKSGEAGESPAESTNRLKKEVETKKGYMVKESQMSPSKVLSRLPVQLLPKSGPLRLMERKGFLANCDVVLEIDE